MSTSSALPRPDDTAPSQGGATGHVCARCRRRFDVAPPSGASGIPRCPDDGAALLLLSDFVAADGDPMLGRTLGGRFTLLARLGSGAMGTVYRARQHPVARDVAIKILRSDRAVDDASRARFLREARTNSQLTSPNTVTVFDFGQSENGDFFLAMELLEGESLGQRLKRVGRLPADQAIDTTRQALRSLAEAHAKGIVHRDLKPDNLFYARGPDGEELVKVVDFGIAKMLRDPSEPLSAVETQAGTVFGTPRYMSPEQAQAKPLDARTDLYSLGVITYQMMVGRPPYMDDDAIVVMARHIKSSPKPFVEVCAEAAAMIEIEKTVMRALAKEPSARFADAEEMSAELSRALECDLASTSGVRKSATNRRTKRHLTGRRSVPPSARSAPTLRLPAAQQGGARTRSLLFTVIALLALFAGAGVVLAVRGWTFARGPVVGPPSEPSAADPGVASTRTSVKGTETGAAANRWPAATTPPVAVESLPTVQEAGAADPHGAPNTAPAARSRSTSRAAPPAVATRPARSAEPGRTPEPTRSPEPARAATSASQSSGYGLFE